MRSIRICWAALLALAGSVATALPPSLRYPLPVATNRIEHIALTCDSFSLNASLTLEHPFKGVLFAKDFSQECKATGSLSKLVSINLPTSGCGVRLSTKTGRNGVEPRMIYTVVVVIQQDRHLRQIADQEKYLECEVEDDAFLVKSQSMIDYIRTDMKKKSRKSRIGRMRFDDDDEANQLNLALLAARAWMEIVPEQLNTKSQPGTLQVGERAILTVKSTLPAGIGWKVVECVAHDGLGDSSQKLLDEDGCPLDDLLLPVPQLGPVRPIAMMRHQEAMATFAAFKFPDRDRLHLSCGLQLCRGNCTDMNCTNQDNRLGRTLSKGDNGEILDRLEVFNSVEVLAPAIDELNKNDRLHSSEPSTFPFDNLPGDRTVCVSPDKMAIAFCILGLIFLCAVMVAACALLRSKRSSCDGPFYSRSVFSSSSSGGSAYGSKLLLHESPCLGQIPPRRLNYGRIL